MANFQNAVDNLETPGYWQGDVKLTMYVPDADESMTDEQLKTNLNELQIRIDKWTNFRTAPVYWSDVSKANMDYIISVYEAKKAEYLYLIESRNPATDTTTNPGSEGVEAPKKNWSLYLIGGAALIYFILKKNKKIK